MNLTKGDYTLSWDRAAQQPERIHAYLTRSYWAEGIPLELVRKSIAHSLCFGVFHQGTQVGFARIVTDYTTYAWLADVYVLEEHRGHGLASWMLEAVLAHPELQGLRRIALATRDAHKLYERFGFTPLTNPESGMEIRWKNLYKQAKAQGIGNG